MMPTQVGQTHALSCDNSPRRTGGQPLAASNSGSGTYSVAIMRQLTVLLVFAWMLIPPLAAENVRIAAWDLDGCEIGSAETLTIEAGQKRLRQVAASLRPINADVIVLRGIRDRQVAQFLAGSLQPSLYHLALHSSLRKGGAGTPGQSFTVLSKKSAFSTQTTEWRNLGQSDLPGGFAFAGINFGPGALCVYAVDFPRDPGSMAGDPKSPLTLRRREVAAQHLVIHAASLGTTPTGQMPSFLLLADLFTGTKPAQPEAAHFCRPEPTGKLQQPDWERAETAPDTMADPGQFVPSRLLDGPRSLRLVRK